MSKYFIIVASWIAISSGIWTVLGCCADARASQDPETLEITSPRPVLKAVEELNAKYTYIITYEEPKILYPGDVEDVTRQRRAEAKSRGKVVMAPRVLALNSGSVEVRLPTIVHVSEAAMYNLLQGVVRSWNDSNQGGAHFEVEEDGAAFHIVPAEIRDQNGNWRSIQSILNAPISFPTALRSDSGTFKAIAYALRVVAGARVFSIVNGGVRLGGPPDTKQYLIGAKDEPGVEVLMRAFKAMGAKRTWYLNYDPTSRAYVLNIDDLQSTTSSGSNTVPEALLRERQPSGPRVPCASCTNVVAPQ